MSSLIDEVSESHWLRLLNREGQWPRGDEHDLGPSGLAGFRRAEARTHPAGSSSARRRRPRLPRPGNLPRPRKPAKAAATAPAPARVVKRRKRSALSPEGSGYPRRSRLWAELKRLAPEKAATRLKLLCRHIPILSLAGQLQSPTPKSHCRFRWRLRTRRSCGVQRASWCTCTCAGGMQEEQSSGGKGAGVGT